MKMNNKEIALKLREDSAYQEFFRNALKKFGSKTPADMSDEEKDEFFTYIEKNWNEEDPATDDNDVVDEEKCDGIRKYDGKGRSNPIGLRTNYNSKTEERLRMAIRREIVSALSEIKKYK